VAQGLSSKGIARETSLSPNTVDQYIGSATKKLGVSKRHIAAQMVVSAGKTPGNRAPTKLIYENSDVTRSAEADNKGTSAGEGDGLDDLGHLEPQPSESRDSETRRDELSHPIAKFFGGENRLPVGQHALVVVLMAIGLGIAFGGVISGLASLS